MDQSQSFRLIETLDTVEITLNHVEGQNIVSWEVIEQLFPGVKRIRNGTSVIKLQRNASQQSIEPSKLDPTDLQTHLTGASANTAIEDNVVTALDIAPRIPETAVASTDTSSSAQYYVDASSKATLFQQVVTRASRKARESEIEQRFISLLAPEVQETVRASSDIYQAFTKAIKNGDGELSEAEFRLEVSGNFQELKTLVRKNIALNEAMNVKQEELNAK
ncbi:unnamed protein product [Mortierella alpina]